MKVFFPNYDIQKCPYCGWIAEAHREKDCGWFVQCDNCGRMTDEYYTNREDAVKEWNGDRIKK